MYETEKMIDGYLICEVKNMERSLLLPPSEASLLYSKYESVTTQVSLMAIKVPPKVWRQKVQNKYILPDYANDVDKVVFDFEQYISQYTDPKKCGHKGVVQI